ncbi:MAG: HAD hydrolase-like protein [Patescibacteria group bacterium]|jgi:FMN phosphatase YigB (HAD superfamily)
MLPKIILFDVGNVVIDADQAITHKLLQSLGVPKEQSELFYKNKEYFEFSRGNICGQDFYKSLINEYLKIPLSYEQVVNAHNQHIYGVNENVIQTIKGLSKYTILFATDTNEWQTAREKELINLKLYSQHIFRSHELHKLKVDDGFFEGILEFLNINSAEVLFIDDDPQKLNMAIRQGLEGLIFENNLQLKQSLSNLGI